MTTGFHWQFGVVAGASSVVAPAGVEIRNLSGTADQINDTTNGIVAQSGAPHAVNGQTGSTISFNAYGATTSGGAPTSWLWVATAIDNSAGLVTSSVPTGPSTQNWSGITFSIAGSPSGGDMAIYEIELRAQNGAGIAAIQFELLLVYA